jgi:hypothetical protein
MSDRTPQNSTNVRFLLDAPAPALMAIAAWWLLVAALACSGSIRTLAADLPALAAFMCAVAVLAYAVDAELRQAIGRLGTPWLVAIAAIALMSCSVGREAWLALSPLAAIFTIASAARARSARISSAAATSPGARRGAL